jgi:predicted RNA binding protein YcfA (HicA-like mRNA interferase family)
VTNLPIISGRAMVAVLQCIGYVIVRQRGSHIRLRHPQDPQRRPVTVPDHKSLKAVTLHAILRDAALDVERLKDLL